MLSGLKGLGAVLWQWLLPSPAQRLSGDEVTPEAALLERLKIERIDRNRFHRRAQRAEGEVLRLQELLQEQPECCQTQPGDDVREFVAVPRDSNVGRNLIEHEDARTLQVNITRGLILGSHPSEAAMAKTSKRIQELVSNAEPIGSRCPDPTCRGILGAHSGSCSLSFGADFAERAGEKGTGRR